MPPGPPPPLDDSHVVKTPLGVYEMYLMARPVVRHLAPGDPLSVAIRWQQGDKVKREHLKDRTKLNADFKLLVHDTVDFLHFEITPPGGKARIYQAEYDFPKRSFEPKRLYEAPSLFITFTETGLTTQLDITGRWLDGAKLSFKKPGTYKIRIRGKLFLLSGDSPEFVSDPIEFIVGQDERRSLKDIRAIADAEVKKRLPDTQLSQKKYGHRGLLKHVIVENKDGNRLVRYQLENRRLWRIAMATVTVTPSGEIAGWEDRDIRDCIAIGTPIETERGVRPIEDIKPGDRVWSYDLQRARRVLTEVRATRATYARTILRAGPALRLTPWHPVYANDSWQLAGEAQGDWLRSDGQRESVTLVAEPIDPPNQTTQVYDLTVAWPHNFFAGGYLVHNKSRGFVPSLDDPWVFMWNPRYPPQRRAQRRAPSKKQRKTQ